MSRLSLASDIWAYLKNNKKWWLLPMFIFLILLGIMIVLAESSVVAPFIYTLF